MACSRRCVTAWPGAMVSLSRESTRPVCPRVKAKGAERAQLLATRQTSQEPLIGGSKMCVWYADPPADVAASGEGNTGADPSGAQATSFSERRSCRMSAMRLNGTATP